MKFFALLLCSLGMVPGGTLFAQDWAKARLEKSSRHHEWVDLKAGSEPVKAFVIYPETKTKVPALVVVHEIFGLTDWAEEIADEIAAAGYIAIVPDLLSAPGGKDTRSYPDQEAAIRAVSALTPAQVLPELDAAADYVRKLPACNGTVAVCGFCRGGAWAFRYANHNSKLAAAYIFYGDSPAGPSEAAQIKCPVYGFYGQADARITASVPATEQLMKSLGKTYQPVIYTDAGHGFMRGGEAPEAKPADAKARDDAWARWKSLLKQLPAS